MNAQYQLIFDSLKQGLGMVVEVISDVDNAE